MTNTPVDPIVEMNINGVWTDITADVRLSSADSGGGIDIQRGTPNEGNAAEPTTVNFVLNNKGGKYSPGNPYGQYYGFLRRNMQVRIGTDRRSDDFARTLTDSWGRLPSRVTPELQTVLGDRWETLGFAGNLDTTGSGGTIQSATGYTASTFGTYSDVEVLTKVRFTNLTSEVGIFLRLDRLQVGVDPGDFEAGVNTWTATGGTLATSTAQFHSGTQSGLLTVAGSPTTATARPAKSPVVPGRTYRARMWVRCSASLTLTSAIDWYDASGSLSSSTTSTQALTANTWTLVETSGTAPDPAVTATAGPNLTGSPANGTLLFIDDVDFQCYSNFGAFLAYLSPANPTSNLRLGRINRDGSASSVSGSMTLAINTDYWIKAQTTGIRRRMKVWADGDPEPELYQLRTYGTLEENVGTQFVPEHGQVGLFAHDGNALVTFDSVSVNKWRAHVEINKLPPRYDLSRQDRWVPVEAKGVLRRYGQGRKTLESPVSLHLASYTTAGSWLPLETVDSTSNIVGNRIDGAPDGRAVGLTQGTIDTDGVGYAPGLGGCAVLETATSSLTVQAKNGIAGGEWSFLCFFRVPAVTATDTVIYTVTSTGTAKTIKVWYLAGATPAVRVDLLDGENAVVDTSTTLLYFGDNPIGCWLAANLYLFATGGTVSWAWNFHSPASTNFYSLSGTYSGSVGAFRQAKFTTSAALVTAGNLQIAHVLHYPGNLPFVTDDFAKAVYAYISEIATSRFRRLADNAGWAATTIGFTNDSKPMGPQSMSKTLDLMQEAADVDGSILDEERDSFMINMRTRQSMWNQRAMDLDIDLGHLSPPLEAVYDDQQTRNDVTVNRPGGSFARAIQTDGPLNINTPEDDPVDGVGTYDESVDLNFQTDDQLQAAANWRVSKGTIDEARYPSFKVDLTAAAYQADPGLTERILSRDSGDMVKLKNTEVSYNPTLQIVQSYTEHMDQYERSLVFTSQAGVVYRVGQVGLTTRLQTRYINTAASFVSGTDTRLSVARTLPGALMVQVADDAASFPFEIEIGGVRLMVEATGNVLNTNPYFDTDITGWTNTGSTTLYRDQYPGQFKEGVAALRMTATASGTGGAENTQAAAAPVAAATDYQISGWLRSSVALTDIRLAVDWYQSNGTSFISSGLPTTLSIAANTWTFFSATVTSPALAAFARCRARVVFLASGNIAWVDSIRLMPVSSYSGSPQILSVRQAPTNGVVGKTVASGSPLQVVFPWRVAF